MKQTSGLARWERESVLTQTEVVIKRTGLENGEGKTLTQTEAVRKRFIQEGSGERKAESQPKAVRKP